MIAYTVRRVLLIIPVAFGVITLLFILSRASGDPAALFSPQGADKATLAATRARLGLNHPMWHQYLTTVGGAFKLDFGSSFAFHEPAASMVFHRVGPSLLIIVPSLVLAAMLAFALGTYAALRSSRLSARLVMAGAFVTNGVPFFWLALVLVLIFAVKMQLLPATGNSGIQALVIPVVVLTVMGTSTLARLVRGQLLDAFAQGPVLTARSKGISRRRVLFRHALPIALPPLLGWLGIQFSFMLGALLLLEPIMNYDGVGALLVRSVENQDFPIVMAGVFIVAVMITAVNVAFDVAVRLLDPRLGRGRREV